MTQYAAREELIVPRMHVADVSSHREFDGVTLQLFRRSRAADAARMPLTGVFGNRVLLLSGAFGKQFSYSVCKRRDVFHIQFFTTFRRSFPRQPSRLGIGEAFLFATRQSLFLDQYSLALVPLARATETNDNRSQG